MKKIYYSVLGGTFSVEEIAAKTGLTHHTIRHRIKHGRRLEETSYRKQLVDLTGKRFQLWTVIERVDNFYKNQPMWKCKCDCGAIRYINGGSLRNGASGSCGSCGAKRRNRKYESRDRRYELCGEQLSMKDLADLVGYVQDHVANLLRKGHTPLDILKRSVTNRSLSGIVTGRRDDRLCPPKLICPTIPEAAHQLRQAARQLKFTPSTATTYICHDPPPSMTFVDSQRVRRSSPPWSGRCIVAAPNGEADQADLRKAKAEAVAAEDRGRP